MGITLTFVKYIIAFLLTNHLPMDGEQVARAAKEMIEQHGDFALVQADKQISTCESEGFDCVAEMDRAYPVNAYTHYI